MAAVTHSEKGADFKCRKWSNLQKGANVSDSSLNSTCNMEAKSILAGQTCILPAFLLLMTVTGPVSTLTHIKSSSDHLWEYEQCVMYTTVDPPSPTPPLGIIFQTVGKGFFCIKMIPK
jgi:hypothetical protein